MSPTSKSFSSKFDLESKEAVGDPCDNNRPERSLWQNTIYMATVSINYINRSENQIAQHIGCLTTFGIALAGSLRSPERFAPATMPVTAVKKTPNVSEKDVSNFHFHINSPRVRKKSKLEKKCKYDLQS